jgi:hypothetical protein
MQTSTGSEHGAYDGRFLARKLGLSMAIACTFFGVLYLLGLGVNLASSGLPTPTGSDVRSISAVIALLWNLALVTLFLALRREADPPKALLAELAGAFAVMVCVTSSLRWFIGLTAYPRTALGSAPEIASLLDPYNPDSFPYALEHLGWGLFFGLAAILMAAAFSAKSASTLVRWSLAITGTLSLAHFVGILVGSPGLTQLGYVSWGVALPASTLLLALMYRRKLRQERA